MTEELVVRVDDRRATHARAYPAEGPRLHAALVLAHGAGAGHDSAFMRQFAAGLATRGVDVLTFNFLYTDQGRRLPDRTDTLEACYRAAIDTARRHPAFDGDWLFIGGKSMGGRIATHLAAAAGSDGTPPVRGVVLLGYPLHPPGKPEQLRTSHLPAIGVPMLFLHGTRDPFGSPAEMTTALGSLAATVSLHIVEGGDHSLAPPKRGGVSVDDTYARLQDIIVEWMRRQADGPSLG